MQKTTALSAAEALLHVHSCYGGQLPSQPPGEHGVLSTNLNSDVQGQNCKHLVGKPRHWGQERAKPIDIRKHLAHDVVQNSHMLLVHIPTESAVGHLDLAAPLPAMISVRPGHFGHEGR